METAPDLLSSYLLPEDVQEVRLIMSMLRNAGFLVAEPNMEHPATATATEGGLTAKEIEEGENQDVITVGIGNSDRFATDDLPVDPLTLISEKFKYQRSLDGNTCFYTGAEYKKLGKPGYEVCVIFVHVNKERIRELI